MPWSLFMRRKVMAAQIQKKWLQDILSASAGNQERQKINIFFYAGYMLLSERKNKHNTGAHFISWIFLLFVFFRRSSLFIFIFCFFFLWYYIIPPPGIFIKIVFFIFLSFLLFSLLFLSFFFVCWSSTLHSSFSRCFVLFVEIVLPCLFEI